jgi:hypothetical protein
MEIPRLVNHVIEVDADNTVTLTDDEPQSISLPSIELGHDLIE